MLVASSHSIHEGKGVSGSRGLHRPLVGLGRVVRGIQHISESTWVCNS